jgi:crotonyl-CoA reductase
VFVVRRGGTVVTCASTSGYMHSYDNRYLWMNLKRVVGSHFANYREAWEANRLVDRGMIHPILTRTYRLDAVADAAWAMHTNAHTGKLGVLVNASEEGQGVRDPDKRARFSDDLRAWSRLR